MFFRMLTKDLNSLRSLLFMRHTVNTFWKYLNPETYLESSLEIWNDRRRTLFFVDSRKTEQYGIRNS